MTAHAYRLGYSAAQLKATSYLRLVYVQRNWRQDDKRSVLFQEQAVIAPIEQAVQLLTAVHHRTQTASRLSVDLPTCRGRAEAKHLQDKSAFFRRGSVTLTPTRKPQRGL